MSILSHPLVLKLIDHRQTKAVTAATEHTKEGWREVIVVQYEYEHDEVSDGIATPRLAVMQLSTDIIENGIVESVVFEAA